MTFNLCIDSLEINPVLCLFLMNLQRISSVIEKYQILTVRQIQRFEDELVCWLLTDPSCCLLFFNPGHVFGWPASTGCREAGKFQFTGPGSIITNGCYPAIHPGDGWTEGCHLGTGKYHELTKAEQSYSFHIIPGFVCLFPMYFLTGGWVTRCTGEAV